MDDQADAGGQQSGDCSIERRQQRDRQGVCIALAQGDNAWPQGNQRAQKAGHGR